MEVKIIYDSKVKNNPLILKLFNNMLQEAGKRKETLLKVLFELSDDSKTIHVTYVDSGKDMAYFLRELVSIKAYAVRNAIKSATISSKLFIDGKQTEFDEKAIKELANKLEAV